LKGKKFFLSHQASIFQEHAVQRCQSRKPKGCGVKRSSFDSKRSGVLNQETGWVKIICISLFQQAVYIFYYPNNKRKTSNKNKHSTTISLRVSTDLV